MIVIRNTFHLKFGKAKDAIALLKEAVGVQKRASQSGFQYRILTDLTGHFYTLVLEITAPSLTVWEAEVPKNMAIPEFQSVYQKFAAFVESGERDVYNIVEDSK